MRSLFARKSCSRLACGRTYPDEYLNLSLDIICKLLIVWARRDGLFGASRLTLRVALAGDRRRCAASSNRLVYVGGSNYDQMALGANPGYFKIFMGWLPGTDSNRRPTD